MDISSKVLIKIQEKNIKPIPSIYFKLRKYFWFSFCTITILLAGFTFGHFLFSLEISDFTELIQNFQNVGEILDSYVFLFFTVIIFFGLVFIAYKIFRSSDYGYKYPFLVAFSLVFLLSILVGYVSYYTDLNTNFYINALASNDMLQKYEEERLFKTYHPYRGVIVGIVSNYDIKSNMLDLNIGRSKNFKVYIKKDTFYNKGSIHLNKYLKVRGKYLGDKSFEATNIQEVSSRKMHKMIDFVNYKYR